MSQGNPGGQDRAVTSTHVSHLVPLRPKSKGGKISKKLKEQRKNKAKTKIMEEKSGSNKTRGKDPDKTKVIKQKIISTKPERKENVKCGIKSKGHKANPMKKEKVPGNGKEDIETSLTLEKVNKKNTLSKTKGSNGNGSNTFHSLYVKKKHYKLKNINNPKEESGTDYSSVSSHPRESYGDGESNGDPDLNDSNGDDYSIDFKPQRIPSRNHKNSKPTESKELENRLSDSGKINSRDVHLREFKPQAFVLKSPEGSEAQDGLKNITYINKIPLSQEQSIKVRETIQIV